MRSRNLEPLAQRYIYCVRFIHWVVHAPSDQTKQACERARQEYSEVAFILATWSRLSVRGLDTLARELSLSRSLKPEDFIEAIDSRNVVNVGAPIRTRVDEDLTAFAVQRRAPVLHAPRSQR
jgi:hypothetical protein